MTTDTIQKKSLIEIFLVSTYLGLTSFGGPIAHLGYFHHAYVVKRKWLDEEAYADLVALCQFLPGPASSQVGIGIGTIRGGLLGGLVAWLGFTLPSALMLVFFAAVIKSYNVAQSGWIHGLKIVAVAIVAHALWSMGQKLANDKIKATIAVGTAGLLLIWPSAWLQILILLGAGIFGAVFFRNQEMAEFSGHEVSKGKKSAKVFLIAFVVLLLGLPIVSDRAHNLTLDVFDSFYRVGALVFGGGHVVLPLLETEVVSSGWVTEEDFLAGYGATQAVPGPMFTFAAYLGAMAEGNTLAIIALCAIFLPSFLLVNGVLPYWQDFRKNKWLRGALTAINAAVVGLLLAALYHPLWTTAVKEGSDFVLVCLLFLLLQFWKTPPWVVVVVGAFGGMLLSYSG